jgi:O-antigen ligase
MFGGVYLWSAVVLALGVGGLLAWVRPRLFTAGWPGALDVSLLAVLGLIALQLGPLPAGLVSLISPGRTAYVHSSSLAPGPPGWLPLTLDRGATVHAWLAAFCAAGAFWSARAIFARRGLRTVITALAWGAVAVVLIAVAQGAAGTPLVYGFWRPYDAGARPLGPFINRNHLGTWSLLVFFLCFGCFQWRRAATSPSRGWSWRARLTHALDGRSAVLVLAMVLLAVGVALGASRSTMLALACGAGYVAAAAPRGHGTRRSSLWSAALAFAAALAILAYADVDRLLARLDETRQLGLSQRVAIWSDAGRVIGGFPVAGAGAGSFPAAMRLYQTADRTYFWNEAHNQYLQIAAEGGLLLVMPTALGLLSMAVLSLRALRRRDDALHWLRLGASAALVAVAAQSFLETGLTLPASGMLAAAAAAIVVLPPSSRPAAPAPAPHGHA